MRLPKSHGWFSQPCSGCRPTICQSADPFLSHSGPSGRQRVSTSPRARQQKYGQKLLSTTVGLDEAKTLGRVEPLYRSSRHIGVSLPVYRGPQDHMEGRTKRPPSFPSATAGGLNFVSEQTLREPFKSAKTSETWSSTACNHLRHGNV